MNKVLNSQETFGGYIRELRISSGIGQRELAKKVEIAASYLNDIEKDKRTAPNINVIKKLSSFLKADLDLLNNLAAKSKNSLPPDITEYLKDNIKIISLWRTFKNNNLGNEEIDKIQSSVNES